MQVTPTQPQPLVAMQADRDIAIRRGRLEAIVRMRLTLNAIAGTEPKLSPEERDTLDQVRDAMARFELKLADVGNTGTGRGTAR